MAKGTGGLRRRKTTRYVRRGVGGAARGGRIWITPSRSVRGRRSDVLRWLDEDRKRGERQRGRERERGRKSESEGVGRPVPARSQARSRVSVRLETPARTERESEVVVRLVYLPFFDTFLADAKEPLLQSPTPTQAK